MTVEELIALIPADTFSELALETKVDHQVKKLTGESVFKLVLFSMLHSDKLSLRVMESFLQSAKFKSFVDRDDLDCKYNSIRDRICTINASYFEQLFDKIFAVYNKELKEEKALSKTDSTYVSLAAKLFSSGMQNGDKSNRFVKYSVNLKGSLPSKVKVYTDQSYVNEDLALTDLIEDAQMLKENIVVFDRGLQSRQSFEKFTGSNKFFVCRAYNNMRCKISSENIIESRPKNSGVTLTSDVKGYLVNGKQVKTQYEYRLIKGVIDATGEKISFLTNITDESAYQIADWYKQRWEIEIFFKFIKQHLNVKHLVSRTENGIKVMLYITMILAILIIAYRKLNKIKGFKIAKLKFEIELENEIIKDIVVLCGGNPDLAKHLWNTR